MKTLPSSPDRFRSACVHLLLGASLASSAACQTTPATDGADSFRQGVPSREAVTVQVPGGGNQALTVERGAQPLVGAESEFYRVTRDVARVVNGGVIWALVLVKQVTKHPATTVTADGAVWGPWAEPLDKNAWRVTINRAGANQYSYQFEGKDKSAPDAAFVVVLSGTHVPTLDAAGDAVEGLGTGTLRFDWDAAQTLPEHGDNVGQAEMTYARASFDGPTTVNAQFRRIKDKEKQRLVDVDYAYARQPDAGGWLEFTWQGAAGSGDDARMAVKSRWSPTGAGRADVKVMVPEAAAPATLSDCWSPSFASQFRVTSWDPAATANYGSEAICSFATAEYSTLPF